MTPITRLRMMTFNIRGGDKFEDEANTWSNRAALNTRIITKCNPAIIGFQECQPENLTVYQSFFHEYAFYLGHSTGVSNYNPFFWKSSHFDLVETGEFWLSPMPDANIPSKSWNASCKRSATWVKLQIRGGNFTLLLVNNHWDHISEEARRESACLLRKKIFELSQDGQLPTVVCGDFNCSLWRPQDDPRSGTPPTNEPYHYLGKQGFIDCFIAAGNKDSLASNTFHGFMGEGYEAWRHHLLWRADWILLFDPFSFMEVQNCSIIRDNESPLFSSDHYPVIADFIVPRVTVM